MKSDCGSIVHSGDNRDGKKDGFDELIKVNFSTINFQVNYLAIIINSYNGAGFNDVETANVSLMQGPTNLHTIMIGGKKNCNAICAAMIYRKNGIWSVMSSQDTGLGKVFTECEELIKQNLI